jgi:F420-non-reducing hydrogenase iron-sulfur subunit
LARAGAIRIALRTLGIDPERFAIEWVSSAEAPRFAEVVTSFTDKMCALGPNPMKQKKSA